MPAMLAAARACTTNSAVLCSATNVNTKESIAQPETQHVRQRLDHQ